MTNTQKDKLTKLINSTNNPYELIAISKTLQILTVTPLDDNEREVYAAYEKRSLYLIGEIKSVGDEDMQSEADSIAREEIYDNVKINGEGDE